MSAFRAREQHSEHEGRYFPDPAGLEILLFMLTMHFSLYLKVALFLFFFVSKKGLSLKEDNLSNSLNVSVKVLPKLSYRSTCCLQC